MDTSPDGAGSGADPSDSTDRTGLELRRTLLAGVIGGVVAAAGYLIYSRLEDDQKDQIKSTVSKFFEDKIADLRAQIKL